MQTERLLLTTLDHHDNAFILAIVNTPGWLKFIGNRNIDSALDTQIYIQNILDNPLFTYWIVRLQTNQTPIGIVSLIKRDYLDAHDLGFAFLPPYMNMGYAYEAAHRITVELKKNQLYPKLYATTLAENKSSIKLLTRLGFHFLKIIRPKEETLHLYELHL
ncbi:GNAT family N-acetyltransferase [Myroides sp. 1354]|uniref:GNAT family N-acetyltransferase n=1 Tax=unclassified Myroides TaxID=2642485 RepID=UPI00257820ED|nr:MULTISPECIES: GNAT family N-acetyltransferase [unclassified Myroides]MDM1045835.1 GNAT family N-acetyltransferase [Myroides sp. R163-1]MDM1055710.1 GNAT family N-acetyltransferase [Myroides sp. 1354]MDM1069802.1 GNAT family N-acetyltransferase [Myroides sp. 1372]